MIIDKKITVNEGGTYCMKLSTGEEIVTTVASKENGEYQLKDCLTVVVGDQGAGLVPWPMIAKEDTLVAVPFSHVVAVFEPRDDFLKAYNESTSKIALPQQSIVL